MHPALKLEVYQEARNLIKNNKSFYLCNQHGERKEFVPTAYCYTLNYLKFYVKVAHELGDIMYIEEM